VARPHTSLASLFASRFRVSLTTLRAGNSRLQDHPQLTSRTLRGKRVREPRGPSGADDRALRGAPVYNPHASRALRSQSACEQARRGWPHRRGHYRPLRALRAAHAANPSWLHIQFGERNERRIVNDVRHADAWLRKLGVASGKGPGRSGPGWDSDRPGMSFGFPTRLDRGGHLPACGELRRWPAQPEPSGARPSPR
jgi:hypothetical protein